VFVCLHINKTNTINTVYYVIKNQSEIAHTLRDYRYVTLRPKPQIRHGVIVVYLWISENGVCGDLTATFWWNKFAKLVNIDLSNRLLKTVTYGRKKSADFDSKSVTTLL